MPGCLWRCFASRIEDKASPPTTAAAKSDAELNLATGALQAVTAACAEPPSFKENRSNERQVTATHGIAVEQVTAQLRVALLTRAAGARTPLTRLLNSADDLQAATGAPLVGLLGAAACPAEGPSEAPVLFVSLAAAGPAAACLPAGEQLPLPSPPGAQAKHPVRVVPPWQAPPALVSPAELDASALCNPAWQSLLLALEDVCPPAAAGEANDPAAPRYSVLLLPLTFGAQLIGAMLLALPGEAASAPGASPSPLLHALLTRPGALEELGACVAECCLGPVLPAVSQVCSSAALLSSCSSVHLLSTALTAALAGPLSSELFVDFGVRLALLPHKDAARGILFEDAAAPGSRTGMLAAQSVGSGSAYCGSPAISRLPSHGGMQPGAFATVPQGLGAFPSLQDHLIMEEPPPPSDAGPSKGSPACSLRAAGDGVLGAAVTFDVITRSTKVLPEPERSGTGGPLSPPPPHASTGSGGTGRVARGRGRVTGGYSCSDLRTRKQGTLATSTGPGDMMSAPAHGPVANAMPVLAVCGLPLTWPSQPLGKATTFAMAGTLAASLLDQAAAGPSSSAHGGRHPGGAAEGPASPTAGAAANTLSNHPRIAVEAVTPRTVARSPGSSLHLASALVANVPAYLQDAAQASDDVLLVARRVSSFAAIAGLWHTAPEAAAARPPAPAVVIYVTSSTALPKQLLGAARSHATELLRVLLPAAARSLQGASFHEWALLCAQVVGSHGAVGVGAPSPPASGQLPGWGLGLPAGETVQEESPFTHAAGAVAAASSASIGRVHGSWRAAQPPPPPAPSTGAATAGWAGGAAGNVPASPRLRVMGYQSAGPSSPLAVAGVHQPAFGAASGGSFEPVAWGSRIPASSSLPGQPHAADTLAAASSLGPGPSGGPVGGITGGHQRSSAGAMGPGLAMASVSHPSGPLQPVTAALPLPSRRRLAGGSYAEYVQASSTGAFERTSSLGPAPSDTVLAAMAAPLFALGPAGIEASQGRQVVSTLLSEGAGSVEDTRQAQLGVMVSSLQAELHRTRAEAGRPGGRHAEDDVRSLQLRRAIGSGSCAVVILATLHSLPVAVKVMVPTEEVEEEGEDDRGPEPEQEDSGAQARPKTTARLRQMRNMLRGVRELAVMTSISHPNIVQVYSYCTRVLVPDTPPASGGVPQLLVVPEGEPAPGPLCTVLIMEYCDMGSLADAIDSGLFARAAKMAAAALARDPRSSSHAFHGSSPTGSVQAGVPSAQPPAGRGVAGSAGVSSTRMLGLLSADPTVAGAGGPVMRAVYLTLLEVALALRHLHSMGLVHCDVKPANVLLRSSATDPRGFTAKLTDFGFVNLLKADEDEAVGGEDGEGREGLRRESSRATFRFSDRAGTVTHMAPEMFLQGSSLDSSIDVYAFGIVMWELYTGHAPYAEHASAAFQDVPCKVVKEGMRPRFPADAPQHFKRLAQECWATPPLQRPTAAYIVTRLQELLDACCSAALRTTAASEAAGVAPRQR